MRFKIVVASYNCPNEIERCLQSIDDQDHRDFDVAIVDDCSEGDGGVFQRRIIEDYATPRGWSYTFNGVRRGAMCNQVTAIKAICDDPDDVIVFCDGDDALAHPSVLSRLNTVYAEPGVDLTYGSYKPVPPSDTCPPVRPFPADVIRDRSYRSFAQQYGTWWNHLRTFKYKLFQQMDEDVDFKDANGNWFMTSPDTAMMTPALELAEKHVYIPEVLYHYTSSNPISEWRVHSELINKNSDYILSLPIKRRKQ